MEDIRIEQHIIWPVNGYVYLTGSLPLLAYSQRRRLRSVSVNGKRPTVNAYSYLYRPCYQSSRKAGGCRYWKYYFRPDSRDIFLDFGLFYRRNGGALMNALTLVFLAFGVIVLIGFLIVFMDRGLKWRKGK